MNDSNNEPLGDLVKRNEAKAHAIHDQLRSLQATVKDYADDMSRIRLVTDNPQASQAIASTDAAKLRAELVAGSRKLDDLQVDVSPFSMSAQTLPTTGATGVLSVVSADIIARFPAANPIAITFRTYSEAQLTADQLRNVEGQCIALMTELKCDRRQGSAAQFNSDLLRQAMALFRLPPQSTHAAGPPLFALRQCIDETTESLKRRLPAANVKGGLKEKIVEIIISAGKPSLDAGLAERLANDAAVLHGKLSGEAKKDALPREATLALLSAGVNWIYRLLSAVDKTKLRPSD